MNEPKQTHSTPDDWLADFTDRVLNGKDPVPASSTDDELRGLEETILRLKRSLPPEAPSEKTLKHLQANFRARVRKADSPTIPVWQLWRPRQRLAVAFAAIVLAVLFIASPLLLSTNGQTQATAGMEARSVLLLAGGLCVIGLLIWARRRK